MPLVSLVESCLRRIIQLLIVTSRFQCAQLFDPEVFPPEECRPNLFLRHRLLLLYDLDDDHPKVVKGVFGFPEVLIYLDRVLLLGVVAMLVNAPVRLLCF